jgi:hypothetical protein
MVSFCMITAGCAANTLGSEQPENNDFYDNTETRLLEGPYLRVLGEVANPGKVDTKDLPVRSLIRRTAIRRGRGARFVGAYRYDGHSLFDILKERHVHKRNAGAFPSVIDLLVVVENGRGEKAVLSWGEIFYPRVLHRAIIATGVAPVIPTHTGEKWPIPSKTRLVVGSDLLAERQIEEPMTITVLSAPIRIEGEKGLKPLYSEAAKLLSRGKEVGRIDRLPPGVPQAEYPSVFYGRGRGFHGVHTFKGALLKDLLADVFAADAAHLRRGYFVLAAPDAYRITVSYSELFNRNDHAEFLLTESGAGEDGGRFTVYPAPDFFSDRAIKAVSAIHSQLVE